MSPNVFFLLETQNATSFVKRKERLYALLTFPQGMHSKKGFQGGGKQEKKC